MKQGSKKDFDAIATILRDTWAALEASQSDSEERRRSVQDQAFRSASADLASLLAPTNGQFDKARFMRACLPSNVATRKGL